MVFVNIFILFFSLIISYLYLYIEENKIHYLLLESNNLFHFGDRSLFYGYSSTEVSRSIYFREVFNKLRLISITIDWSLNQQNSNNNNDMLSSFMTPSEDLNDSPKTPFLRLNGYVMLGCHILDWIHQREVKNQHQNQNQIENQSQNNGEIEEISITSTNEDNNNINENNENIYENIHDNYYNDIINSAVYPVVLTLSQFFENIGTFVRQNILENTILLQHFPFSLNELFPKPSLNTLWIDLVEDTTINPKFFTGLSSFLSKNGFEVKLMSHDTIVQPNDTIIIYHSTISSNPTKETKMNQQITEKLTKYTNLSCHVGILTDLQRKNDIQTQLENFNKDFQNNEIAIFSISEISEQMFQFIQNRFNTFDEEVHDNLKTTNNNKDYYLFESITKLSNDLNESTIEITKNFQPVNNQENEQRLIENIEESNINDKAEGGGDIVILSEGIEQVEKDTEVFEIKIDENMKKDVEN